ncbi:MAG: hypothetical protein FWD02_05075 [Bacteroidales bacterium]|nr:hypothetical protein [Bacteroidales bacterium]
MRNKLKTALKIAGTATAIKLGGDALAHETTVANEFSANFPTTNVQAGGNLEISGRFGRRGRIEPSLELVNRFRMKGEGFDEKEVFTNPFGETVNTSSYNIPRFANQTSINVGLGIWLSERDRIRAAIGFSPSELNLPAQGQHSNQTLFEYLRRMRLSNRKSLDLFTQFAINNTGIAETFRSSGWYMTGSSFDDLERREFDETSRVNGRTFKYSMEGRIGGRFNFEVTPRINLTAEAFFGRKFINDFGDDRRLDYTEPTKNVISIGVGAHVKLGRTNDQIRRMQSGQRGRSQGTQRGRW